MLQFWSVCPREGTRYRAEESKGFLLMNDAIPN